MDRLKRIRRWFYRNLMEDYPGHHTPILLFGGRVCIHGAQWGDIRLWKTYLVVSWRKNNRHVYLSPNGTPTKRTWSIGTFRYP